MCHTVNICECRLCHLPFAVCLTCVLVSARKSEQEREQERERESKRESDAACRLLSLCRACWCLCVTCSVRLLSLCRACWCVSCLLVSKSPVSWWLRERASERPSERAIERESGDVMCDLLCVSCASCCLPRGAYWCVSCCV